jgi:hypothetical protein
MISELHLVIPQISPVPLKRHVVVRFFSRSNPLKTSFRLNNVVLTIVNNFFKQAYRFFYLFVNPLIEFFLDNNYFRLHLAEGFLHGI